MQIHTIMRLTSDMVVITKLTFTSMVGYGISGRILGLIRVVLL